MNINQICSLLGHRSDARCLAFSSCNTAIASVSHETLKVSAITIIHEPLALDGSTVIHMYLGMDTGKNLLKNFEIFVSNYTRIE